MNITEIAAEYLKRGWHPVYIKHKTKAPTETNWQKLPRPAPDAIPRIFKPPCNVGIRLGRDSNNLIDFDLDCHEAVRIASRLLPKTMSFGRKSKPNSHYIYYGQGQLKTYQDKTVIELRCSGQTVFPGSVHETDEEIKWTVGGTSEPATISFDDAVHYFNMIDAAATVAKHWSKGNRDDLFLSLCGGLLKAKGWNETRTKEFISLVCLGAEDEEEHARLAKISRTAEKIKAGEHVNGWPTLRGMIGDKPVERLLECLGIQIKRSIEFEEVDFDTIKPIEVTYLWEPYLPHGELAMISGDPGIGKGWVSLAVAKAVVTSGSLPGQSHTETGKVLLFTAEDSLTKTVAPRLHWLGLDKAEGKLKCYEDAFDLYDGMDAIEAKLEEHKPKLVIIDPFMSYTAEADTNTASEMKLILTPLSRLAQRYSACILLVNHLTKGGRDSALYRSLGSIGIVASVRSMLMVSHDPDDPEKKRKIIVHSKSNIGDHGKSLLYRVDKTIKTKFEWCGISERNADEAFDRLKARPSTARELAEEFLYALEDDREYAVDDLAKLADEKHLSWSAIRKVSSNGDFEKFRKGGIADEGKWYWKLKKGGI